MKDFYKIIEVYKLEKYFSDVFHNNSANKAPYHNLYHTLNTMRNGYKLCMGEKMNVKLTKNILIAALFHDFNHSEGKLTDDKNIKEAVASFQKYTNENKEDNIKIIDVIKATQYPYVIDDKDLNESQKIIRDADLMQTFADNNIQQVIIGLVMTEMGKDLKTTLDLQDSFVRNMKFYTDTANKIFENKKPIILEDIKFLKKTLL